MAVVAIKAVFIVDAVNLLWEVGRAPCVGGTEAFGQAVVLNIRKIFVGAYAVAVEVEREVDVVVALDGEVAVLLSGNVGRHRDGNRHAVVGGNGQGSLHGGCKARGCTKLGEGLRQGAAVFQQEVDGNLAARCAILYAVSGAQCHVAVGARELESRCVGCGNDDGQGCRVVRYILLKVAVEACILLLVERGGEAYRAGVARLQLAGERTCGHDGVQNVAFQRQTIALG